MNKTDKAVEGETLMQVFAPKMTIEWKDKPHHFDTKMVKQIWFARNQIWFTVEGEGSHVNHKPIKSIERITAN